MEAPHLVRSAINTVYKRELPSSLISFTSPKGKELFKEGLKAGTMENYFDISIQYTTQQEPMYCGPASLIMVLNALHIDPNRPWKGIWRWFSEEVLHCTSHEVMQKGMDLEQMTQLARCNGLHTQTFRPVDLHSQKFEFISQELLEHKHLSHTSDGRCCEPEVERASNLLHHNTSGAEIKQFDLEFLRIGVLASSRRQGFYAIGNICRQVLEQTGSGHFTPLVGYHQKSDKVLLFDTARFKYPPHWISLPLLFKSMQTRDSVSLKPRGLITCSKKTLSNDVDPDSVAIDPIAVGHLAKILCTSFKPQPLAQHLSKHTHLPNIAAKMLLVAQSLDDLEACSILFVYMHEMINRFSVETALQTNNSYFLSNSFQQLLQQIRATPAFPLVLSAKIPSNNMLLQMLDYFAPDYSLEFFALLLLSLPKSVFFQLGEPEWMGLVDAEVGSMVRREIEMLRAHMGIEKEVCHISSFCWEESAHQFLRIL